MVALRCLLVMYIVWLIISYTASHLIGATGSTLWPTSVWTRVRDLCVCRGGVDVSVHEGKKAATLSRPNAQVKQLTSVTVGFCFCSCFFFLSNCYFYCERQKHFHFNCLSALSLGKIGMLWKWNKSIVLGQNYKIKYVGKLFIYCYKVFFWGEMCKEVITYMKCIFKDFFLHPGCQEYKKEWIYLTIAYCDSSNSTNFQFMEFICWRWFKLSLVLSCGNISYVKM